MNKSIRSKVLLVLCMFAFLSVTLLTFSLKTTNANANSVAEVFQIERGASVSTEKDGLRFRVKMNTPVYQKLTVNDSEEKINLSVIIAPLSYYNALGQGEEYIDLEKFVKIDIPEDKIYSFSGVYYANAVLTNLASYTQYDYNFVAVGCIEDVTGTEPVYQYTTLGDGEFLSDYARSQYQVISAAVLDTSEEAEGFAEILLGNDSPYKSWFGTDAYPLVINNLTSYENLVQKINDGILFEGKTIHISSDFDKTDSSVDFATGKSLPETAKTYHVITFKMLDGSEIVKKVIDGESLTDIPDLNEVVGYNIAWDKEINEIPTASVTYTETKTEKPLPELSAPFLADFSDPSYARIAEGADAVVVNDATEGSVMKVMLELVAEDYTNFTLNLPKAPTEKSNITIRFMVPSLTNIGGLDINGGNSNKFYSVVAGEWFSYTRPSENYGSTLKVAVYSSTAKTFEMYFSLVVDGEYTNDQMRNMKLFGNIQEGYLADYSSKAYESMVTGGSYGVDITNEYLPTHYFETDVLKISAKTRVSTGCIRLFLPKECTENKVTIKYMIDKTYGIAGDFSAIVNTKYDETPICSLSKEQGIWHVAEIDLSNQTEKNVIELMFNQSGSGVQTVIYVSFVYDGVAPKGYLADYSSESYESMVTGGSYGVDITNEYLPTHAEETNVLKISATTRAATGCIRLYLPNVCTMDKVTIKYMIDENHGIVGDFNVIVNTKYDGTPIRALPKETNVWHVAEIDLSNQTEKNVIELMFNQTGAGVKTVIYVSFVYDGELPNN